MILEPSPQVGFGIPPCTPHTMSSSLPRWEDNVAISLGQGPQILKQSTYSRFVIHPQVDELSSAVLHALGASKDQHCFLFPTARLANEFRLYLDASFSAPCAVHNASELINTPPCHSVFAALFTADFRGAMRFYMFTGSGISPRLAEVCLQRLKGRLNQPLSLPSSNEGHCFGDYYIRHSPLVSTEAAKQAIRTRFAGIFGNSSTRGVDNISADDVYLYSSGMHAIWETHKLIHDVLVSPSNKLKVAHVNFLYCDTYKFIDLPGATGHHFFTDDTLDKLEALLKTGTLTHPAVLAIFTDFPGNPHLTSTDMIKLHALARCHGVPLIVDETIGGLLNVQLLPHCDVIVSSLTKLFSGLANVLAGAIMLNPASPFYSRFKTTLDATYEDTLFRHDALILEMNSREYVQRTIVTNSNTEFLSDKLFPLSQMGGAHESVLKAVYYPKYRSRKNFEMMRNSLAVEAGLEETGYGPLLSVTFTSVEAAKIFYAALRCYKGTTLGTVFTIATAFSALTHPPEKMDWLEQHGVEESLVRFSVGMEDPEAIYECVRDALDAAQRGDEVVEME
ncbi:PLC-like phosphodiesterase [Mycena indigotica]|uniref:PLC-like phosphodiesterase n=1 Tax=Mycena indigotica TaxID=2126181 RepID=A0A8H6S7X9_9AGAR|nr:PLC-like phosphodiesterase [Mycena indigotica]KAF7294680.1 PLC-like phosphodiesterase [Mycena indigotica]